MELSIRLAKPEDARLLLEWRNDPITRENSFQKNSISWEEHSAWYTKKLNNETTRIYILEHAVDGAIGQVRFEKNDADAAEVNLVVAALARGKGYGKEMLSRAMLLAKTDLKLKGFQAFVKSNNVSSLRLFAACGFVVKEELMVEGLPTIKLFA